ncbi:hypothetical protein AVEN_253878-1 [Araneus ventricosus]|uniref:Uncharacterized protein n=1 Tax=Araneus ventricosus TaxID=182803 RepID=A0A4Y2LKD3_ARAVE|nr:hypothetical protein AVEN_253878-1 [Araneus ventricosus]
MSFSNVGVILERNSEQEDKMPKKLYSNGFRNYSEFLVEKYSTSWRDVYTYLNTFKGQTRVHIRVFFQRRKWLLRSSQKWSLPELTDWSDLLCKMCHFEPCKDTHAVLTVRKDVCLFDHTVNYRFCVSLQRLFQRKDLYSQIFTELVVLSDDQFNKLWDSHELLLESVKINF